MSQIKHLLLILSSVVVILGMLLRTDTDTLAMSHSSLTGLATLRTIVQESVSYESAVINGKPTLLEFYAYWCKTCQRMAPIVKTLEEQYGDKINIVMLNIDDPKSANLIETYQVTGVPQFTFLDAHHTVTKTWVGNVPEPVITQFFARLAS